MKITDIINSGRPSLSFEVFPPKTSDKFEGVLSAASEIAKLVACAKCVLFVEEGILNGGFSETMVRMLKNELSDKKFAIRAIDDNFAAPTSPCDLYDYLGLSPSRLADAMLILSQ